MFMANPFKMWAFSQGIFRYKCDSSIMLHNTRQKEDNGKLRAPLEILQWGSSVNQTQQVLRST